ncbi:MAG: hypothetical protein WCS94_05325 [Verrucomicrobiota bacterium]
MIEPSKQFASNLFDLSPFYKGRSRHCGTFHHSNPDVPEYGIHDIARIGSSKAKLADWVDQGIFRLEDLPTDVELTPSQQNQVDAYLHNRILIRRAEIAAELSQAGVPGVFPGLRDLSGGDSTV